jgi:hypothetical protein
MSWVARAVLGALLLIVGLAGCGPSAAPVATAQQQCERGGGVWRSAIGTCERGAGGGGGGY